MPAVSLGDVTFGLGADTKGLNKSIKVLNDFGKKIDNIARKQGDASSKTVAQMSKQEDAVRKALQQVLRLNQQMRNAGVPPAMFARSTQAFGSLTKGLTATNLTYKDQLRLQGRFQAQMGKSSRALSLFKADKARKSLSRMGEAMRDLESASVLAVGPLSGVGARIRAIGAIAKRSTLMVVGLLAGITGLLVVVFKLSAAALRARAAMDRINSVMMQATGSAFFARKEFEFVAVIADKMGQQVESTAQSFAEFAAAARDTALEGQGVRDVFTGVLEAVTALKLPLETQKGLFRALIQMMSKGVIQSEELRGQFGERLAGGFELVRKEVGKTRAEFAKMLKTGQLISDKFVPAIGRAMHKTFGEQAPRAANTLESAINRLSNAQLRFNLAMDEMVNASSIAIGVINSLTAVISVMGSNLDATIATIGAVVVGMLVLAGPVVLKGIFALGRGIKLLTGFMLGLNIAVAANPLVLLATIAARIAIALGAAAAAFFVFNAALDDAIESTRELIVESEDLLKLEQLRTDLQLDQTRQFIKNMAAEIAAVEARVVAQQALVDSLAIGVTGVDLGETSAGKRLKENLDLLAQLRINMDALITLVAKGVKGFGDLGDDISDALEDAIDEVKDFAKALERANMQIENLKKDVALDPSFLEALFEAQDIIEELTQDELVQLQLELEKVGFSSVTTAEGLTQLIFAAEQAEDKFKDLLKAFEKSPDIMKDINQQFDRMRREIDALGTSIDAVDKLNEAFEREDAIEKYREELEKMTEAARAMVPTLEEFITKFDELEKAKTKFEELKDITKELESTVESAFSTIASSIVDGIKTGELSMKSFIGTLEDVASAILEAMIQMLIIGPIMNSLKGALGGLGGGILAGGGGAGGSLFGGLLFSEKGNVFNDGRIKKFAKGTVLSGPTILPLANGDTGIAGEAGPEGVLPLARTNTGDLGVKIADGGGGRSFTVNLNFPPDMDLQKFRQSRGQVGAIAANILSQAAASQG